MNCKTNLLNHTFSTICLISSRRSPSNYRRSSSRHSIKPSPVPVDKLLFLRYRAKENMKFGIYNNQKSVIIFISYIDRCFNIK
jgi:hypothetical protein